MSTTAQPATPSTWTMSPGEVEFLERHHPGFDRQFFTDHLLKNLTRYIETHGLNPLLVDVVVTLENGEELSVVNADPALTWTALTTRSNEMRLVPMSAIRQIAFRPLPGEPAAVGFSAGQANEPATRTAA